MHSTDHHYKSPTKQLLLDIQPLPPPSLDNFIVGQNAEALYSLKQALTHTEEARFIYLWGAQGSGKSHLLHACERIAKQLDLPLCIADDTHLLDEEAQIALFDQFNQLRASGGILISSGIAAPTQMNLRDDLATRLAWGLVYQLHPLTDEEKAQALRTHATERGMRLPDEVVEYCLRYLRRDLPTLMAVLDALDVWSLTEKKPVTVPMLKKLLQHNLEF
ncbi:MAG: DnaA regulatory inactivator Hda [Methylotenera sp.]|uniref:HdaA/DnaA family protein n=1 Tax=Methylotenera sp. TaxID=2051956 RepID=UPI000D4B71FB|nr:DnaA/Hda family protein [Methylotenera sp.]PPC79953.1 MAG: DnaA regulatory inactivator Hda [Methylotenera sp.]